MSTVVAFAVDGMLGRLGKYLRALGYDTLLAEGPHEAFLATAAAERRVLVTLRKRPPASFGGEIIHLEAGPVERQLAAVFAGVSVTPSRDRVLTVCLECNHNTRPAAADEITAPIPPRIRDTISTYRICPGCGRVYWWGSHAERILELLERSGVFR